MRFLLLLALAGCTVGKTSVPVVESFDIPGYQAPWSAKVRELLDQGQFEKLELAASDFEKRFCPNYSKLPEDYQKLAWGYLVGAVTRFESNYMPAVTYKESDGAWSIGLFQLSYGNKFCPRKQSEGDLKDPLINIDCAVKLMGHFVEKDRVVASGGYVRQGAPDPKGLARYWAVIRVPDKKRKHKLSEIISMTRQAPGCLYPLFL